ncbi:rhodanese-like domain-containing protein [Haloimpatiens lingqiaonensis]|uniref:rhodanese-like domain-containing protein n=1 Tax=Haloimpatiens lingqiaonensis TaxID=1380675 RepID=UPI001FA948B9|nr:rhodanese-like domain-containing protein [Haloimpatiens lingqiaonensis]
MKRSKKVFITLMLMICTLSTFLVGCKKNDSKATTKKDFNYYTAEKLKEAIEKKEDIIILDIQVKEEYDKHHIKGAMPTYAFPVKTDEEKKKIDDVLGKLEGKKPIIIVCPRGGGGAENTYKHLLEKNIEKDRLFILEKGQTGWPYEDLLEK